MKTPIYKQITRTLATASQIIIAAPVRLPPKIVAIAKYVSLGVALLDTIVPDRRDVARNVSIGGKVSTDHAPTGKEAPGDGH